MRTAKGTQLETYNMERKLRERTRARGSNLAAGNTPISWLNGLNGEPNSKLISRSPRSLRSEANVA